MGLIIINKKCRWSVPSSDSSKYWSREPTHATNASDHDLKNIFRKVQQKNVKRSAMKSKHTQARHRKKWDKNLYLFTPARDLTILFRTKELSSLWNLISQQNSKKLSELFPGQWQFLILDNDVLWSSIHRRPLTQTQCSHHQRSSAGHHMWHMSWYHIVRRPWHGMMSQVSPDLLTPHSTSQWPPASGQTGPSVKSDPISKPFVKTFYVQQFLFVFVVRHSSSVPHVPWLGHRGQKSRVSSENVTPGQIFIETRS